MKRIAILAALALVLVLVLAVGVGGAAQAAWLLPSDPLA